MYSEIGQAIVEISFVFTIILNYDISIHMFCLTYSACNIYVHIYLYSDARDHPLGASGCYCCQVICQDITFAAATPDSRVQTLSVLTTPYNG